MPFALSIRGEVCAGALCVVVAVQCCAGAEVHLCAAHGNTPALDYYQRHAQQVMERVAAKAEPIDCWAGTDEEGNVRAWDAFPSVAMQHRTSDPFLDRALWTFMPQVEEDCIPLVQKELADLHDRPGVDAAVIQVGRACARSLVSDFLLACLAGARRLAFELSCC
jgi:hypothetical protein